MLVHLHSVDSVDESYITNCNQKTQRTNLKWWESLNTQNLPPETYFLQQSHTSPEQGTKYSDVQEYGDISFTPLQSHQNPKISSEKLLLKYFPLYLSSQQSVTVSLPWRNRISKLYYNKFGLYNYKVKVAQDLHSLRPMRINV